MSMTIDYFHGQVKRIARIWLYSPVLKNNLNAISNALGSDTTTQLADDANAAIRS